MALTKENKALMDLNHFEYILKYGHNYNLAPDNSEHKLAYELGSSYCNQISKMITKINNNSLQVDNIIDPFKVFDYITHLMTSADHLDKYCQGTCENDAYKMPSQKRKMVLQMIDIIRNFDPFS